MNRKLPPNILLHSPVNDLAALELCVENWLSEGVKLVAVWGPGCELVHDIVDEIVVGEGDRPDRVLLTSWHARETLAEAREFASDFGRQSFREVRL